MKPRQFVLYLASVVVGMIASSGGLFLLFDRLVAVDREHKWRSYHEIVLDFTPGPRILIDSGSNSLHAIVRELIETELKRPTFVVADNAAVPLRVKLDRLEKYAKSGDIIILPLEWSYYETERMPADFLDQITTKWSEYYFAMTEIEQFRFFISHIRLDQIISEVWRFIDAPPKVDQQKNRQAVMDEKNNWSGVTKNSIEDRKPHPAMEGRSCSQFIFAPTGELRDLVQLIADRLSKLQQTRNVTVILTWPAVAGTDCYDFAALDSFVEKVRQTFGNAGIAVIGDPRSSLVSKQHLLDNYYHVDIEAGFARTRRLIEDIKQAGLLPVEVTRVSAPFENGSAAIIATALMKEEARITQNNSTLISPLVKGEYVAGTKEFESFFQLPASGWHDFESWGVWSRGDRSEIVLRPQPNKTCGVKLDAHYFSQARPSTISVDGKFLKIDEGSPIWIAPGDRPITIGLQHRDAGSPRELGVSDDPRVLAFGLSRIIVGCE
jgi:hypothetical protein